MSFVASLKLYNFRCYAQASLNDLQSGPIVLHGPNGAGKTNMLEAVSLLAPGRGLRGAKVKEIQCQQAGQPWAVSANVQTGHGIVKIGTGLDPAQSTPRGKRMIRIQGEAAKSQAALSDYVACIWLTPQMDRLFLDSAGDRRRFFDRLIFTFDPGHVGRITRYENAMRQRSRLLQERKAAPAWLDGLEAQMAETGVAIAAARLDFAERLQHACARMEARHFPQAELRASGTIEDLLRSVPALEAEDMFKYQLAQSRGVDMQTGGAATGPHKSDLSVRYALKNMPAAQCSTGEQKALLIALVLAHAQLMAAERGAAPILLLDEVAAHLDEGRRTALYDILQGLGGQVWLTGTDENLFSAIRTKAQFFKIRDAEVQRAAA